MILENFKEDLNESKYNISIDDSMSLIFESYVNDYTIFEAVLRRDFYELIREQEEDKKEEKKEESNKSDRNFFVVIWEKIVNAFKTIREKISSMINNIVEKINKHKQEKANLIVKKYKKLFDMENGKLKEFTYKCKPMKIINMNRGIREIPKFANLTEDQINSHMKSLSDIKKLKEDIHKDAWEDKEVDKPFEYNNELKDYIIDNITDNMEEVKQIKQAKKRYLNNLKENENEARLKLKEAKKNKEMSKEDKDKQINLAQLYLKAINATQKELVITVSSYLKEVAAQYKSSYKIYISAGKWLEKELNTKAEKPKKEEKVKGEVVDDGSYKEPQSKEDFDKIRNSAVDESRIYNDALLEAEFFEYDI